MSLCSCLLKKNIPEDVVKIILQKGSYISLKKGSLLIKERNIERYLYYIEKGECRFFITRERDAEEITFQFAFEGEFVNSLLSFKTGEPSAFSIEALSPCNVWAIHKRHWEYLIVTIPIVKQLFQEILEELFIAKLQREIQMLKYSPEELYLFLIQNNPTVFTKVPSKHIATYLGITPQSFCRLKSRITAKSRS